MFDSVQEYWPYLRDAIDLTMVALALYWALRLIRGSKALSMLLGVLFVVILYFATSYGHFETAHWLLKSFINLLPFILVVIFQSDIRKALVQVGSNPFLSVFSSAESGKTLDELVRAVVQMANHRVGALVILERHIPLGDYIEIGTDLDALVSKEILRSIFNPASPLHDGAVIIQKSRIVAGGCILPLSMNPNLSKLLGTRHRAAIGLTEETDAVAIVVSEEEGKVSLVVEGKLTRDLDAPTLRQVLQSLLAGKSFKPKPPKALKEVSVN